MRPDPPSIRAVEATAADARYWLTTVAAQRALRPLYVDLLAQAMIRREWRWSVDVVAFTGKLHTPGCRQVNGMHRSYALVRADELSPGITVPLLVGQGFTDDAALTFDTGRTRSLADTLDFQEGQAERPGHRDLAALGNLAWHVTAGTWASRTPAPTRVQLVDFVKGNPDLLDAVEPARQLNRGVGGGIAGYGVAVWLMARGEHVALVSEFVEKVTTGEMLRATSPAYVLREHIRTQRRTNKAGHTGERATRSWWIAANVIWAWNAYVGGRRLRAMRTFNRQGEFPEAA